MERSHRRRWAWVIILVADVGVLVYGVMAAVAPTALIPGYESYSNRAWPELVAADTQTAQFILLLFRLVGAIGVFEVLEFVGIAAIYAALAVSVPAGWFRRPSDLVHR
jgi:hypothetical protein